MVYSNCHQRGNSCLKHLKEESVIVMGSKIGGVFCFDTVFVVGKRLGVYSFATQDVEKKLMVLKKEEKLSDNFWEATIKPLLKEHIGSENREFVLYKAATYDQKTGNGMYSFFPCKIFDKNGGFPRPKATSQWISHGMSMNYKRHVMDGKQAKDFWESLRKDVLDSGLYLGVKVEEPNQKCVLKG